MGFIPRKLNFVAGYVHSNYFGELPYEDKKDKYKLEALLQLYDRAAKAGRIEMPKTGIQIALFGPGITKTERAVYRAVMTHAMLNIELTKEHIEKEKRRQKSFLGRLLKKLHFHF